MKRKFLPLILMLSAGAVTCVITWIWDYTILGRLIALMVVLVLFYILGSILKATLDHFDKVNGVDLSDGEVIEKSVEEDNTEGSGGAEEDPAANT